MTTFTAGPGVQTLPIWIFNNLFRPNQAPVINVVAAVLIVLSIVPIYLAQRVSGHRRRRASLAPVVSRRRVGEHTCGKQGGLITHREAMQRGDVTHRFVAPTQPGPRDDRDTASVGSRRLRVLLVEDDEADAFLVQELLEEAAARIDISVASTLAQARERIDGVDCVLLDLGLPDAEGLDGLRALLGVAQGAAVCVLTGLGDEQLGSSAVAEGAQDYLIKGQVDGVLLARAVRYAVERKRADDNARRLHEAEILEQENRRLQRGLLPQPILQTDSVRVHAFYQPGRHRSLLGGDFYDVVQTATTGSSRWSATCADTESTRPRSGSNSAWPGGR